MGRVIDEIGNRYGKLVVVERATDIGTLAAWVCKCDCGGTRTVRGAELRRGRAESCGCTRRKIDKDSAFIALYDNYSYNAIKRGHEWSLTVEYFKYLTSKPCHYCGNKPAQVKKLKGSDESYYVYNGIDRLDNEAGYKTDNVVPCCGRCNMAKGKSSLIEFISWIESIKKGKPEGSPALYVENFTPTKEGEIRQRTLIGRSSEKLKCKRCSHEWFPLTIREPKVCPSCKGNWREPSHKDQLINAGVTEAKCKKCGHEWFPRSVEGPKVCPSCCNDWRTPYKNKSRQVRNEI